MKNKTDGVLMEIKVKRLTETAQMPIMATDGAAGFDLYADTDKESAPIYPGETKLFGTGVAVAIPKGCFGAIYARSGLATKRGLRPANCVGVIDSDYRGEIIVALHNDSHTQQTVNTHERIAQLIIQSYSDVKLVEVDSLDDTERGAGGFGSTGVN